jgi:uncharacterized protein (TIGR03086 family)
MPGQPGIAVWTARLDGSTLRERGTPDPEEVLMDAATLHRRTVDYWDAQVGGVSPDQWNAATPCTDWNVHDLVNHVVGEERWTVPLVHGSTIEEVGHALDGDLLGEDPVEAGHRAAAEARAAVEEVPLDSRVHLSYGDEDLEEYLRQLAADHLVHGWDLAVATGGDSRLDPELIEEVATWFAQREEMYRAGGVIGPHLDASGDPQTDLLAAFGRDARWATSA